MMPPKLVPNRNTRQSAQSHPYCVQLQTFRTGDYHNDFFNRTARLWNDLPAHVFPDDFNKKSPQLFKTAVHKWL